MAGWLAGFPICELLIKLASFWLGAPRSLWRPFSGFGALQKSGLPICEVLIKLATVDERPMYICTKRGPQRPNVDRTGLSCAWLAGWLGGWLAGGLKLREAQRGLAGWLAGWRAEAQKGPEGNKG